MKGSGSDTEFIHETGWYKLDNAAKLFPAIMSRELTSVFRVSATLRRPVNYMALKEAVALASKRFPYFSVSLGSGLFWHYLELNNKPPRLQVEENIPCTAFASGRKNEPLYRVLAKSNRISVEFIHILTDGFGAMEFLKTLLLAYFRLTGNEIPDTDGIILPESSVSADETEDGYRKFYRKDSPPPPKLVKAWHLPFKLNAKPRLKIVRAEIDLCQLLSVTRERKATVTEYLAAVYLFSLQKIFLEEKQKNRKNKRGVLRIEVPVNMRQRLPSKTMRNFSLFVMPEIDARLGEFSFEEILKHVSFQIQTGTDIRQISRFLSQNVGHEKNPLVRILPLFIKTMAIAAVYRKLGSERCTGIMTNMGNIQLPSWMEKLVESVDLIPTPPNEHVKISTSVVSFANKMHLTFCNITGSRQLEKYILRFLSDAGINVKVCKP